MAVSLDEISKWLDGKNIKYDLNEERIRIVVEASEGKQVYFIRAREDGDIFEMQMQLLDDNLDYIDIKDHQHAGLILQHLLYLNYKTKFGTWEFDPSDGDIRLAIEIPLEDAKMTENQFNRVMGYMISDASDHVEEIKEIMETGKIPVEEEEENNTDEIRNILLRMLETLDGDTSSNKDDDGI